MIKTLRITSVLAAVMAVVVFSFSVVYGMRPDPEIEEFLKSPGVIEQFKQTAGNQTRRVADQTSPLVQQAKLFSLYLDPPAKPEPPREAPQRPTNIPTITRTPPRIHNAKFKLIGTSVHKSDPNMSLAFIDEPGVGLHWVRQSSSIMHLEIVEVKDAVVVVNDGQRTFEVEAEPRPVAVSLEAGPGNITAVTSTAIKPTRTYTPPKTVARNNIQPRRDVRREPEPEPQINEQENAALSSLVERLKSIKRDADADGNGVAEDDVSKALNKVMSDFKESQVGKEEAKKLDDLGKKLNKKDDEEPNDLRRPNPKIDSSVPRRPSITERPQSRNH